MTALRDTLWARFGLEEFRPGQEEAIAAVLDGRDLVAVMPTGSGKSLCFQLPALLLDGVTLVVSPLIALMKDQVDGLRERGLAAAGIHSLMSAAQRSATEADLAAGRLRLLYVAPERLAAPGFRAALGRSRVARLVVDEAHCISQWGHDFRPDYTRLGELRQALGVPAAAFTATATPDVRRDIARQLGMGEPVEIVTGFERPNLTLSVEPARARADKMRALDRLLRDPGPPGIVYAATRKNVELWAAHLEECGLRAGQYHGGLPDEQRHRVQDLFLAGRLDVIAATNAFGMGVDKADLRFVAHADVPGSIEAYYQEVGRAGRDGKPSRGALFFSPADVRTQEFFLAGSNPPPEAFRRAWQALGEGADEDEIEALAGGDATQGMALQTAARVLRRAAEGRGLRVGAGAPPIDLEVQAEKARRDRGRLDIMLRYAFGSGCRTRFIYDYFAGGARAGAVPRCGTCDVCLGWRHNTGRPLDDREYEQVRIALSAVARLNARFGLARIAEVLAGSGSKEVLDRGLDRMPTYGRLKALGTDAIKRMLDVLLEAGLLERRGIEGGRPGAFVLALTEAGSLVMKAESRPMLALPGPEESSRGKKKAQPARGRTISGVRPGRTAAIAGARATADGGVVEGGGDLDEALLADLKSWRTGEARRRGIPAYIVFHDRTLVEIATVRPRNATDLGAVAGLGPAKMAAYADVLLALLAGKQVKQAD
jgi:ATP-dependent DNA helicase RecQ